MSWQQQLDNDRARVVAQLDASLAQDDALDRAMRYAVLGGGKRLRAHLVYEGARLNGVDIPTADAGALAIELIHAYSLVHDDLPAMDDDDLRRGQPTVHKKWNEWTAILVGDNLQSRAFEILGEQAPEMVATLAHAASRMVRGQFQDLSAELEAGALDRRAIEELQANKTGALIEWSTAFGARVSSADPEPYFDYARALGTAFQIWDDVLDVEASQEELGKAVGKDSDAGKATFVSLMGHERAKNYARDLVEQAQTAIASVDRQDNLRNLASFVITRRN